MSGFGRGAPRGAATRRGGRGNRGFGRGRRGDHMGGRFDSRSPDRRSMSSEGGRFPRFNNYREPSRHFSRSPERSSSPPNRQQNLPRNQMPMERFGRPIHPGARRSPSPPNRQYRLDERPPRQQGRPSDRRSPSPQNRSARNHPDGRQIRQSGHPSDRRSPSPPNPSARNNIDERSIRQSGHPSDRRSPSPPNPSARNHIDGRPIRQFDSNDHRIIPGVARGQASVTLRPEQKSEKEVAREFAIILSDADEAVRRAEYELRRAEMLRNNLCDNYEDFLNTIREKEKEAAKLKSAW